MNRLVKTRVCIVKALLEGERGAMFTSRREKWKDPHVIALVELDMQKLRLHIVLSREAISERLRELQHPPGTVAKFQAIRPASDN